MEVVKSKKKKRIRILIILLVIAFLIYAIISTIIQQIQIGQKQEELATIQEKLSDQNIKNDELKSALDSGLTESEDYIKRSARETLDFVLPGEQVFVNISGD